MGIMFDQVLTNLCIYIYIFIGWKLMVLVSIVKTGGSGGESRKHQQNKSNFWQSHCGTRNQQCSHDYAILKFLGNSTPCYVEHLLMGAFR